MQRIQTIAVIGAGQMGSGIAQVAALSNFKVLICDSAAGALGRCQDAHAKRLAREVEKGRLKQNDMDAALSRIHYVETLDMLKGADAVIEAVVEDSRVKHDLFATLAKMFTGQQILASNTSSISITEIAAAAGPAADRVIGMHFFNPVPVMKLVEVIKGLQTSHTTTERVTELARAMGKTPVPANDRAGFVSNRVLMPLINEAFYAWMEGVAEPQHIDDIMKLGCNFPMGPLRLADFIGLDTCVHIMNVLADGLNNDRYRPCPLLKQLVAAGRMGDKSGRGVFDYTPARRPHPPSPPPSRPPDRSRWRPQRNPRACQDSRRRWRYFVLVGAAVVIVAVALVPFFRAKPGRAGAELYAPFQQELIGIMSEGQPEGENAFPVLLQIRDLLLQAEAETVPASAPPEAESPAEQFARAKVTCDAANAKGLPDLARTYAACPRFVRPPGVGPPAQTVYDELGAARAFARMQSVRMRVAAAAADDAEFLTVLGQTLTHARFLCFEPVSFGRSTALSIYAMAIADTRFWLAAHPPNAQSLASASRLFKDHFPPPPIARVIRGEYAIVRSAIADVYANGNEGLHRLSGADGPRPEAAPFQESRMGPGMPSLAEHKRIAEEFFADLTRVAEMPRPKRIADPFQPAAAEEWMHQKSLIVALCISGFKGTFNAEDQFNAEAAGIQATLAVERFHLAHGSYPSTLADLVPEFLPALPVDPYTGAPLPYRLGQNADSSPAAYTLYAAGTDGVDNGGKFDQADHFKALCDCPEGEGLDLLLNPAKPD